MNRKELWSFCESDAFIRGKFVKISVDESIALKERAIFRGFASADGTVKRPLTWLEQILVTMRDATTADGMNHEWWGAESLKPEWVRRLDLHYRGSWLYASHLPKDLDPYRMGKRIGHFLTLNPRKMELALTSPDYCEAWKEEELDKARRGKSQKLAALTRVRLPGNESLYELAQELSGYALRLRASVMQLANSQPVSDSIPFTRGFADGQKKAAEVDLDREFAEVDMTKEVVDILSGYWDRIAQMQTRTEISEFIRKYLPDRTSRYLRNEREWVAFTEGALRDIYKEIKLSPSSPGRPKKTSPAARPLLDPAERIERLLQEMGETFEGKPPIITHIPDLRWVCEFDSERFKDTPAQTGALQS